VFSHSSSLKVSDFLDEVDENKSPSTENIIIPAIDDHKNINKKFNTNRNKIRNKRYKVDEIIENNSKVK